MYLMNRLRALKRDSAGQDLLEYALLIGLIALVAYGAVAATGTSVSAVFSNLASTISGLPVAS